MSFATVAMVAPIVLSATLMTSTTTAIPTNWAFSTIMVYLPQLRLDLSNPDLGVVDYHGVTSLLPLLKLFPILLVSINRRVKKIYLSSWPDQIAEGAWQFFAKDKGTNNAILWIRISLIISPYTRSTICVISLSLAWTSFALSRSTGRIAGSRTRCTPFTRLDIPPLLQKHQTRQVHQPTGPLAHLPRLSMALACAELASPRTTPQSNYTVLQKPFISMLF